MPSLFYKLHRLTQNKLILNYGCENNNEDKGNKKQKEKIPDQKIGRKQKEKRLQGRKKTNAGKKKSAGCARRRERVAGERESDVFFFKLTQGHN